MIRIIALLAVIALSLTACGGDDDLNPPLVTITSHVDGDEVAGNFLLSGMAVDEHSTVSFVYYNINGGEFRKADLAGTAWSASITFEAYGVHTNQVYAVDSAGNASEPVFITLERVARPVISIVSPPDNSSTNQAAITLAGNTAIDPLQSVIMVKVSLNGGSWQDASGTTSWTHALTLVPGENLVSVQAFADNGTVSTVMQRTIHFDQAVYVSSTGSDAAPGTRAAPVRSLQTALSLAVANGFTNIRVQTGTYSPGSGLNTNELSLDYSGLRIADSGMAFSGGWNASYTSRTGTSTLDGDDALCHIVWLQSANNVSLTGFTIVRGLANLDSGVHRNGAGIYVNGGSNLRLSECMITSNQSVRHGAGIYLNGGTGHLISGAIFHNAVTDAGFNGGGIYVFDGIRHTIDATIAWNSAGKGGGVYVFENTDSLTNSIRGTIASNQAGTSGGGVYSDGGVGLHIEATLMANQANGQDGGGLYMDGGKGHRITGEIRLNMAPRNGGGLYIVGGTSHLISATLSGNYAVKGGGVYQFDSDTNATLVFESPVISGNFFFGYSKANINSQPQGVESIVWGMGNFPGDIEEL